MPYKSIAKWPFPEVQLGNTENESQDTHDTEEQASAICRRLRREGLGGQGKVFPLETRVEHVQPHPRLPDSGSRCQCIICSKQH